MSSFFFFSYASPFYYVRGSTLLSHVASVSGVECRAIFHNNTIPDSAIIVFNRFCAGKFFSTIAQWCCDLKIPYIFDIDDAYWELPSYSTDDAASKSAAVNMADGLAKNASLIVCTTKYLASQIQTRFPNVNVAIVPNATSQSQLLDNGICIANTDSFKFGGTDMVWFRNMLRSLVHRGVPVTLLGENQNFFEGIDDFCFQMSGRLGYDHYLAYLQQGRFRYGFIPVEASLYADCKSDIKVTEFLGAGMSVYASDIMPYREALERQPMQHLKLVGHSQSAWERVADEVVLSYPQEFLAQRSEAMEYQQNARRTQFEAWLHAAKLIEPSRNSAQQAGAYGILMQKIKNYQFMQRKYHQLKGSRFYRGIKKVQTLVRR